MNCGRFSCAIPRRGNKSPPEPAAYSLLRASLGWRDEKWDFSLWLRNLTNEHYLQNVTVQAGNSGLVVGTPADPRSFGATLRASF